MIRALAFATLLLAAPTAAQPSSEVDAFIRDIYAPYSAADPDWETLREKPMFSAATSALIDEWMAGADPDEVEDLADFDWICDCQDWDAPTFELQILPHAAPANDRAEVSVRFHLGLRDNPQSRFLLVRENGAWLIDDLYSRSLPNGLKAALREAMAAQAAR